MEIIYGTSNLNKVIAMKKILKENNIDAKIYTLKEIGFNKEIIENGKTFEENSSIKAEAIKTYCNENNIKGKIILTDDAGLCIDKLNGEPGVYSARYAGENATQKQILEKVLSKMEKYPKEEERTCTFVCVLTAITQNRRKNSCKRRMQRQSSKNYGKTRRTNIYTNIYPRRI